MAMFTTQNTDTKYCELYEEWVKRIINQPIETTTERVSCKHNNLVDINKITKKQITTQNIYTVEGYVRLHTEHYHIYIPQEIINLILFLFSKSIRQIKIAENIQDISECIIWTAKFIKDLMQQRVDVVPFKLPFQLDLFIPVDIITYYNTGQEYSSQVSNSKMLCDQRLNDLQLNVLNINYPYTLPDERYPIILNEIKYGWQDDDDDADDGTQYEASFLEQDQYCTLDRICKKMLREFIVPKSTVLYSTADQLRCKLMVFTFNLVRKHKKIHMECYLILNEKIRFYGKDIIAKLPAFFDDNEQNVQFIEEQKQNGTIQNLFDEAMQPFDGVECSKTKSEYENKNVVIHYGNKTILQPFDTNEHIKAKIQRKEAIPMDQEPCIVTDIECDNGRILFEYDSTL